MMVAAVDIRNLRKTFRAPGYRPFGRSVCRAIDGVSLRVEPGERIALLGPSGSGKSTLLRHVAGLIAADPESGVIDVLGSTIQDSGRMARDIRRQRARIGFIFQQFNLVGRLSLLMNVQAGMLAHVPTYRSLCFCFTRAEKRRAMTALARVGMAEYATQRASTLSGGQQQRGAIARAMLQGARVLLADEPIASLDPESSRKVMESLVQLNQEDGVTLLVSLHQVEYARTYCPRAVAMRAGRIIYDGPTAKLDEARLLDIYGAKADEICFSATGAPVPCGRERRLPRERNLSVLEMAAADI